MAAPTPYVPAYDFSSYQTANPADPLPGDRVDIEFAAVKTTTDNLRTNLAVIQRSDNALANAIVTPDSLSTATRALLAAGGTVRGVWATATAYAVGDVVSNGENTYIAATAHTSGTFATDLGNSKWLPLSVRSPVLDFREFGGHDDGSTDNSAVWNSIEDYAAANDYHWIHVPYGTYRFTEQPDPITVPLRLTGDPGTVFQRHFNPDAATDPFFDIRASRVTIADLSLIATAGTQGVAVQAAHPNDESYAPDWGVLDNLRIYGGAAVGWTKGIYLDGLNRAGSVVGIRDWKVRGCYILDMASGGKHIHAREGVNVDFAGGGFFAGSLVGGAAGLAHIEGASGAPCQYVNFVGGRWSGTIDYDWTSNGHVSGCLDTALQIDANCANISYSASGQYVVTDASSSAKGVGGNQFFNKPGLLDLRVSGAEQLVYAQRTDTHGAATIFDLRSYGKDSAGASFLYGQFRHIVADATASSEDSAWHYSAAVAGTLAVRMVVGAGVTIGAGLTLPGVGKLNVLTEIQINDAKVIDATGHYIAGTKVIDATGHYVGGNKIIGARDTGWAADTGTADKTAKASYAGQTISGTYQQSEVQAIDDRVKILSEQVKALKDLLITTHPLAGA